MCVCVCVCVCVCAYVYVHGDLSDSVLLLRVALKDSSISITEIFSEFLTTLAQWRCKIFWLPNFWPGSCSEEKFFMLWHT